MSLTDGKSWWEEHQARARRLVAGCSLAAFVFAIILFHSAIQAFFSSHSWWQDALATLAGIALPVLAGFELRHSTEANELRREANRLRAEEIRLQDRIGELEAEKAGHLAQIAANTKRPVTQAERNAEMLRQHLRSQVAVVNHDDSIWSGTPEIVDVSDEIVTLFMPHSQTSSSAWCVQVHCNDLEITPIRQGSCPLRIKVRKRYGPNVELGGITKWEDRNQPEAAPLFDKGGMAYQATFNKPGSHETRSLYVFASKDGRNSFLLETGAGQTVIGDNVEISKRFAIFEVDYKAEGFNRHQSGTGGSPYPLFIHS